MADEQNTTDSETQEQEQEQEQESNVEEIKTQLEQAQEQLAKLSEKDHNFGELNKQVKELKDQVTAKDEELNATKTSVMTQQIESHQADALNVLVGQDDDMRAKIKHAFENDLASIEAKTKEEVQDKMRKAYGVVMSTNVVQSQNPINQAMGVTGQPLNVGSQEGKLNDDQKDLSKKLGIKEDSLKNKGLI
jgi:hypothetical protein